MEFDLCLGQAVTKCGENHVTQSENFIFFNLKSYSTLNLK